MDEGKFAADFVAKNFEKILDYAKKIYATGDEIVRVKLKLAYSDYISRSFEKYSKSKSFFIRNQSVDLYTYYVPASVACSAQILNNPSFKDIFSHSTRLVLLGSGGSGKSVLMRHLFLDCMKDGEYVPIMLELRDMNGRQGKIEDVISENLDQLGFNISGDYIRRAKQAGHFAFFLDGFDEINGDLRPGVVKQIESLAKKYDKCPIFISSRPDDEFNGKEDFFVVKMQPLGLEAAVQLVKKLPFDKEVKNKFVDSLKQGLFETHESFLSNPLLLSIMLLTYGENAEIPTKLSIFYNQAYEALFQRHDAIKGAYSRNRKTSLDIQDFARVFALFSLQTYDKRKIKMSRLECLDYIAKSKSTLEMDFDPEDYLEDLMSAACLMMEDGLEIAYSHRSFQEYFVAVQISNSIPEIQAKLLDRYKQHSRSDNVIKLLLEINPNLVEREFLLPILERMFSELGVVKKVGVTHYLRYLKKRFERFSLDDESLFGSSILSNTNRPDPDLTSLVTKHMQTFPIDVEKITQGRSKYKEFLTENNRKFTVNTKSLKTTDKFFIFLRDSHGYFSMSHLSMAWQSYKKLKARHDNAIDDLDALLKIKK